MRHAIFIAALLASSAASAQSLPQPNQNGNGPNIVCIWINTATTMRFNGAPITSPAPYCNNLADADLVKVLGAFAAACVPPSGPPPCTPDQVAYSIGAFVQNRLTDRIADIERQAAAAAASQAIAPITVTPAN